ncbi:MAG TPA: GAP family protein [Solirubrobacteraceae bacterium]|nr:GAP family protein [Solirubrobacteraceae bacterium]
MGSAEVELLLTAVAAMLSPTTLTFSVLALVLGERPIRTGTWFYLGALGATLLVGVVAAFVLEDVAAAPAGSSQPKTWVAILDLVIGALALSYAAKLVRKPMSPESEQQMVDKVGGLASSPAIAVVGAGAALANPGGFIPIALKDISQLNPNAGEYIVLWIAFALISLLPLSVALVMLRIAPDGTLRILQRARDWLTRNASRIGAVLITVLGVVLLRDGIAGLTG